MACYNRIFCSVLSLTNKNYGINKQVIFIHVETLQEAIYRLKSSTKVSEMGYKHCVAFPIHGTVKGSPTSPIIWCFILCMLFDCHKSLTHLMKMSTPSDDTNVALNLIGFANDTICTTGTERNDSVQDLIVKMKEDAQL